MTSPADRHTAVDRRTVDLSAYPELVVIYLGIRVRVLRGVPSALEHSASDHERRTP